MTYNKIQVLMLEPGKSPTPVTLSTSDYSLRKAVNIGGNHHYKAKCKRIEDEICVLYNANKINPFLTPNRCLGGEILSGVIYIVAVTSQNELRSLSNDELHKYAKQFLIPEEYTKFEAHSTNLTYLCRTPRRIAEAKEVNIRKYS